MVGIGNNLRRCRKVVCLHEVPWKCQTCGVRLTLAALKHQKINGQVKEQFLEPYIHFTLICTAYHIFSELSIKDSIKEDRKTTTPSKLATITTPSILDLRILSCMCVVQKTTAHVGTKMLNMCHQAHNQIQK